MENLQTNNIERSKCEEEKGFYDEDNDQFLNG
jgi:hypothetical protein